ncbi:hypothetical protein AVEN_128512-1, partial [Araneus ventricosus]
MKLFSYMSDFAAPFNSSLLHNLAPPPHKKRSFHIVCLHFNNNCVFLSRRSCESSFRDDKIEEVAWIAQQRCD